MIVLIEGGLGVVVLGVRWLGEGELGYNMLEDIEKIVGFAKPQ